MMYSEFLKGTGAPENKETYEQFSVINRIYMDCCQMTKQEAYDIWEKTYGKEIKLKRKKMLDRANMLFYSADEFDMLPREERQKVFVELDKMFWSAFYNKDGSKMSYCQSGMCFIDDCGIAWFVKQIGTNPNGSSQYGLFANVDGIVKNAHYSIL